MSGRHADPTAREPPRTDAVDDGGRDGELPDCGRDGELPDCDRDGELPDCDRDGELPDGICDDELLDDPSTNGSPDWTCHYCGRRFALPDQAGQAHALLVRHVVCECSAVPASVRGRYGKPRGTGNCDV